MASEKRMYESSVQQRDGYNNSEEGMEIDLVAMMYRLLERAKYIVLAALVGALIAGVVTLTLISPKYTATSKLYVVAPTSASINMSDLQLGSQLAADYQEVFSNWQVQDEVLRALNLSYSYKQLSDMVEVKNPSSTHMLYITAEAPSPQEAKAIADTYAQVARRFIGEKWNQEQPEIFQEAMLPERPSSPNKRKNVLLGVLMGIFLSCAIIIVQFIVDDRIRSAEDIEKHLGMATLGMMPHQNRTTIPTKSNSKASRRGADA